MQHAENRSTFNPNPFRAFETEHLVLSLISLMCIWMDIMSELILHSKGTNFHREGIVYPIQIAWWTSCVTGVPEGEEAKGSKMP